MVRSVILGLALGISSFAQQAFTPQTCPATGNTPSVAFKPPALYLNFPADGGFLYGTAALWTWISPNPMHTEDRGNLSAKLVYWRAGFDWKAESNPDLKVIAKRLDAPAPLLETLQTHAVKLREEDTPASMAMMTGITFPEPGCWQIVATYKGIDTLSYIAWVVR